MTLAQIAEDIHDKTGATGSELEWQTHFIAMMTADACGNKAIADYFQRRMRDAFAKANQ